MKFEIIPGFHALEFKEQAQARVQAELEGLSPEERLQHIRESVENGPFGDLWRRMRSASTTEAHEDEDAKPVKTP